MPLSTMRNRSGQHPMDFPFFRRSRVIRLFQGSFNISARSQLLA
jgi:hypothetical protein